MRDRYPSGPNWAVGAQCWGWRWGWSELLPAAGSWMLVFEAKGLVAFIQSLSHVWPLVTPWTTACQVSLSLSVSWSLLKFTPIESVMLSNHLFLCCPLLIWLSILPSIRVFSNELALHIRWPKYWSFSFSISPSNEYSELISFRIDCFDLPALQGTPQNLLQHHNSKASIFPCSAFFMVQLSHLR